MSEEIFEQTFQVTEPARLKLSNIRGSVEIQAGEPGVIWVKAIKHNGSKPTTIQMSQAEDGTVVVETREPEGSWRLFGFSSPAKVAYQVRVPTSCSLRVSCVSSSMSISGVSGEFSFSTVSGDIGLHNLTGPLKINTVSGDVSGSHLSGELSLETVSGDIRFDDSDFASVRGSTVSGNLFLHTALGAGPYKLSSVSGDVHFMVPEDTACTAEVHGVSGTFTSTLPISAQTRHGGGRTAQVQGGGVQIKLNSVSGDLWIGKPGDEPGTGHSEAAAPAEHAHHADHAYHVPPVPPAPPTPPRPPVPPAPVEEKLTTAELLAMVERGELSVDEAIRRMQG